MSYNATVYKVMIASPKDVEHECQLARQAINKWNTLHSEDKKIVLLPIGWDTDTAPEMGEHPQKIIDKQILAEADLLVAIFLHRLGTPTLDAQSGTAHEIDSHTQSGKPAMVYFLEEKVDPSEFNREQYDKLVGFKQNMKNKGLLHECKRNHFENKFLEHLTITVNKNEYIQKKKLQIEVTNFEDFGYTDEITLTSEAKTLLMEAVDDRNGRILKFRTSSGTSIQTKDHNLIPNQNPRTIAKWEYALDELINNEFAEERGSKGEVFAVTHTGYSYADNFKKGNLTKENSNKSENYSKEELAVIELIAQNGEGEVSAIEKHLSQKHNSLRIDAEAAISSLAHSKIIRQTRTSPICYKLSPEGSIWASKNKHLWLGEIN